MNERVGNPFLSATLVAVVLINWKLSLLLFSDITYDIKVLKIAALYPDESTQLKNFLFRPICAGFFWTIVWPAISMGITAYWYLMRSKINNVKLWAEKKKRISDSEAAELYSTIDAQQTKYLDLIKERQTQTDKLSEQITSLINSQSTTNQAIFEKDSTIDKLQHQLINLQNQSATNQDHANKIDRENDSHRQSIEEIRGASLQFAGLLPGLKELTISINQSTNHHANDNWLRENLAQQNPALTNDYQSMLRFFVAIGLLEKIDDGHITFGARYKFEKDKVLSARNIEIRPS